MAISTDYPRPITVNGYICRNCDDVSAAKKNIDPAEAKGEPPAVSFGGSLGDRQRPGGVPVADPAFRLLDRYA
jgi:hypothetical protein